MGSQSGQQDAVVARIEEQVRVASQRLDRLSGDVRDSAKGIERAGRDEKRFTERFEQDLASFREDVDAFKDSLESFRREVGKVASRFKSLVEKENLSAAEERVDKLPLERFISRREFFELLRERFGYS